MDIDIIEVVGGFLLLVGFIQLANSLLRDVRQLWFAQRFVKQYRKYCGSTGGYSDTYQWLIDHAEAMQAELGEEGIFPYQPAFRITPIPQYHVILDGISDTRNVLLAGATPTAKASVIQVVEHSLNQHIGGLRFFRKSAWRYFLNPLIWSEAGVRLVVTFPLRLLQWMRIISELQANRIRQNRPFKLLQVLVSISVILVLIFSLVREVELVLPAAKAVLGLP